MIDTQELIARLDRYSDHADLIGETSMGNALYVAARELERLSIREKYKPQETT
jgi:hypothetical protein